MKKFMMVLLAMSIVCIMAVGGTMSYLTYTDYDVNTMVVGNVKIEQLEQMRDKNGDLKEFVPYNLNPYAGELEMDDGWYDIGKNALDKIVSVKNSGSEDAYVRTVFAFEIKLTKNDANETVWVNPLGTDVILNPANGIDFGSSAVIIYRYENGTFGMEPAKATAAFVVGTYTYGQVLSGHTSGFSLKQVCLANTVGNDFSDAVNGQYEILVLSQAVQIEGFDSADAALNQAFGALTADNAADWFDNAKEGNG